jgi:hypothetical protein
MSQKLQWVTASAVFSLALPDIWSKRNLGDGGGSKESLISKMSLFMDMDQKLYYFEM